MYEHLADKIVEEMIEQGVVSFFKISEKIAHKDAVLWLRDESDKPGTLKRHININEDKPYERLAFSILLKHVEQLQSTKLFQVLIDE